MRALWPCALCAALLWNRAGRGESPSAEVGAFVGAVAPSSSHDLGASGREHQELSAISTDLGVRLAFFPHAVAGVEAEGMLAPTATHVTEEAATLGSLRAHALVRFAVRRVHPFVLLGGGTMGLFSTALGDGFDPLVHWGVGAQWLLTQRVALRVDFRDNLTPKLDARSRWVHHPEWLLGVLIRLPAT